MDYPAGFPFSLFCFKQKTIWRRRPFVMKAKSVNLFDTTPKIDKYSFEFDLTILEQLKQIKTTPELFGDAVKKIMKQKSRAELWVSDAPHNIWVVNEERSGGRYQAVNYRCCPTSKKAKFYFCLLLDKSDSEISVIDGWLTSV
jgi:hypothetical protein